MKATIWIGSVALVAALGFHQDVATVKTKTGSISGEIQGIIVAKRPKSGGAFDLAVIDGPAIRSIDERGILTSRGAWMDVTPVEGITMMPENRIAERLVSRQVSQDPSQALTFTVLGEVPVDKSGNVVGDIIPRLRLKSKAGERIVQVSDLVVVSRSSQ